MEPFKNAFNVERIQGAAAHFQRVWPDFDAAGFIHAASDGLDALELKARAARIATTLGDRLPEDWPMAAEILVAALGPPGDPDAVTSSNTTDAGIGGWMVWPMADVVANRGLGDLETSLDALHALTQRWSGEFAIRPFLVQHTDATLARLHTWTTDSSPHVRRLVSEGTRPRLPWGLRLTDFVADPSPTLPLLEALKDDPSEYVRRSVANHLGDIAKDHADLAVATGARWLEHDSARRKKLVKHGLRWLIKKGHAGALAAFGYGPADVEATLTGTPSAVQLPGKIALEVTIVSRSNQPQALLVDYVVHHVRADGGRTGKTFKWTTRSLPAGEELQLKKSHAIRPISTRRYYPGQHRVELQINGRVSAGWDFDLCV